MAEDAVDVGLRQPGGVMLHLHLQPLVAAAGLISLGSGLWQMFLAPRPIFFPAAEIPVQVIPGLVNSGWGGILLSALIVIGGIWRDVLKSKADARRIADLEKGAEESRSQRAWLNGRLDRLERERDQLSLDLRDSRENANRRADRDSAILMGYEVEIRELKSKLSRVDATHVGAINRTNDSVQEIAHSMQPPMDVPEVHIDKTNGDHP